MDRIAATSGRHALDALLLKMALEGKDFQKAREELEASAVEDPPPPRPAPPQSAPASSLSVDVVEIAHLEARLETADVKLSVEATRVTVVQVRATSGGQRQDPLLLDLDGDGPETTGAGNARAFDLAGDGTVAPTSWVSGGDAFLALDRDGDGRIGSGKELFGDQHGAVDGFAELAKFDENGDARIDAGDAVYSDLRLWDGQSQRTLQDAGITALALAPDRRSQELSNGDAILASGTARAGSRTVYVYAMALQTFGGRDWVG